MIYHLFLEKKKLKGSPRPPPPTKTFLNGRQLQARYKMVDYPKSFEGTILTCLG
jgi:hypothetical protein